MQFRSLIFPVQVMALCLFLLLGRAADARSIQGTAQASAGANEPLIKALEEFKAAALAKIDSDIETTARAFWNAYDIQRSRRVADLILAPLTVIEQAIGVVAAAKNASEIGTGLQGAESLLQVVSLLMGLSQLSQAGQNLQVAIDGLTYSAVLKEMLTEAGASSQPGEYAAVVKLHLYGIGGRRSPVGVSLVVAGPDKTTHEVVWGAAAVKRRTSEHIDQLIKELETKRLGSAVQVEAIRAHLASLTTVLKRSRADNVRAVPTLVSPAADASPEIELGTIGAFEHVRQLALTNYDNDLRLEQISVLTSAVKAGTQVISLKVGYKTPDGTLLKEVRREMIPLGALGINILTKFFATSARREVNELPHEMTLSLPGELANTWKLIDGAVASVRALPQATTGAGGGSVGENEKATQWLELMRGEEKFGFKLDREGILSYRGKMLTPKLEVHGELGDSRYPPPKVVISRLSPSGRYAFVKACEASDESALCWFLYLIDTKRGQMLLTFAGKYGPKDGIKWSPDEAYAIVPYSSEGATWLYGIDLVTGKSEEISMWHLAKSDGRWICPGESGLVVDAESLSWRENNKRFYIKVEVQCSSHDYQETQVARRYEIAVDVPSFHVEVLSRKAPTPVYAKASPPDFLTSTTIDPETQVRFSLIRGKGCRRSWGYRVEVIGEVPKSSDVLNDNLVRGILEKARDFAVNLCPLFKSGSDSVHGDFIEVYLFDSPIDRLDFSSLDEPEFRGFAVHGKFARRNKVMTLVTYENPRFAQAQAEQRRREEEQRRQRAQEEQRRKAEEKRKALELLSSSGSRALPTILSVMNDKDSEFTQRVAKVIEAQKIVPSQEDIPRFIDILQKPESSTIARTMAATALGEFGLKAKDAVPALTEASKGGNLAARKALRRIKFPNSPPDSCRDELSQGIGGLIASTGYVRPCPKEGDEEKKAAADKLFVEFNRKHRVQNYVDSEALSRNPFAYEGKVVAMPNLTFDEMITRDRGLFSGRSGVAVSGIPQGIFSTRRVKVILAGRVLGNIEIKVGPVTLRVPHLQYVGVYICQETDCADFSGPASMR